MWQRGSCSISLATLQTPVASRELYPVLLASATRLCDKFRSPFSRPQMPECHTAWFLPASDKPVLPKDTQAWIYLPLPELADLQIQPQFSCNAQSYINCFLVLKTLRSKQY